MKSLKKGTRKQEEDEDLKSEAPLWVRVLRLPQLRQTQRTHHNKKIGTGQLQRFVYVLQQILYSVESKTSLS